jgi:hypothetical protein
MFESLPVPSNKCGAFSVRTEVVMNLAETTDIGAAGQATIDFDNSEEADLAALPC